MRNSGKWSKWGYPGNGHFGGMVRKGQKEEDPKNGEFQENGEFWDIPKIGVFGGHPQNGDFWRLRRATSPTHTI